MNTKRRTLQSILLSIFILFPTLTFAEIEPPASPAATNESYNSDLISGTFTTNIPIKVAPGINGMQPKLALSYNSRSGNGLLGMGWDINGLGYIELDPKARFTSAVKIQSCNEQPVSISFNGNHSLILHNDGYYHTKLETFLRIEKVGDYWKVTDKSGTIYTFGSTADTRLGGSCGNGSFGLRKWFLDTVTDKNNNSMKITYVGDASTRHPERISYGNNREIFFLYGDNRDDTVEYYLFGGEKIVMYKWLTGIQIKMGGELVRSYQLGYEKSPKTGRKLLNSIQEFAQDTEKSLPAILLEYHNPENLWEEDSVLSNIPGKFAEGSESEATGAIIIDMNSDNRDDFISPDGEVWLSTEEGWSHAYNLPDKLYPGSQLMDLDNDGDLDFVYSYMLYFYKEPRKRHGGCWGRVDNGQSHFKGVWMNDRNNSGQWKISRDYIDDLGINFLAKVYYKNADDIRIKNAGRFVDLNDDGYPDYVLSWNDNNIPDCANPEIRGSWYDEYIGYNSNGKYSIVKKNTGSGLILQDSWKLPEKGNLENDGAALVDINGDRVPDLIQSVQNDGDNKHIWINKIKDGGSWEERPQGGAVPILAIKDGDSFYDLHSQFVDLNNDGFIDFVLSVEDDAGLFSNSSSNFTLMNTGVGWKQDDSYSLSEYLAVGREFDQAGTQFIDLNGDGLIDVTHSADLPYSISLPGVPDIYSENNSWINTGSGWSEADRFNLPGKIMVTGNKDPGSRFADLNGDGLIDFMIANDSIKKVWLNKMFKIDLLKKIKTVSGGTVSLEYSGGLVKHLRTFGEMSNNQSSLTVVKTISKYDGLGNDSTTTYSFSDGLYRIDEQEFRGFKNVEVTYSDGSIQETEFYQDDRKGKSKWTQITDSEGNVYTRTENQWYVSSTGSIWEARSMIVTLAKTDTYTCDGFAATCDSTTDGSGQKHSSTEYTYDDYGNITKTSSMGDVAVSEDNRYVSTTYNYSPSQYVLNKPDCVTVYDFTETQVLKKTCFTYYPTTWNVKNEIAWFDGGADQVITYEYDDYGNRVRTIDPKGYSYSVVYDTTFNTLPVLEINANGNTITKQYYGVESVSLNRGGSFPGLLKSIEDANGGVTLYKYDQFGRITTVIAPYDSSDFPTAVYVYHIDGTLPEYTEVVRKQTDSSEDNIYSYTYIDGLGRTIETVKSSGRGKISAYTTYDNKGRVKTVSIPGDSSLVTTYEYDALDRVTNTINTDDTFTVTVYDRWSIIEIDENGNTVSRQYDAYNRLIQVDEYRDGISTTQYTYDTLDNLNKILDYEGNKTTIEYDSLGRKKTMDDPDMGLWTYGYDANSNLISQSDHKMQSFSMAYDNLNRVTSETSPDGVVSYIYDNPAANSIGKLYQVIDPVSTITFNYDLRGRVVKAEETVETETNTIEYFYNSLDQITSTILPDGEMAANKYYSDSGLLSSVESLTSGVPYSYNLKYNNIDKLIYRTAGNAITTTFDYQPQNFRLASVFTRDMPNQAPAAGITAEPMSGQSPLTVNFSESGDDSDGAISLWRWDFGDGETAFTQNVQHTYMQEGEFTATLTITDNEGAKDSASVTINVTGSTPDVPMNLVAFSGVGEIFLSWKASPKADKVVRYDVYRKDTIAAELYTLIGNTAEPKYLDQGLTNGTRYFYVVTAVDGLGVESDISNEASEVPDDYGNTMAAASTAETNGDAINGGIEAAGDIDYFTFMAEAGFTYIIKTFNLEAGMDTVVYLYAPDGGLITEDDNSGVEAGASRIEWLALQNDRYYIAVTHAQISGTGGYNLSIRTKGDTGGTTSGVWIGTEGGVSFFDGTAFTNYTTQNSGLAGDFIYSIAVDESGATWFGTYGKGVSKFDGTSWTTYNTLNSGLASDYVFSIEAAPDGALWFGTSQGVSKFDGITWTLYNSVNSGLGNDFIWDIIIEPSGILWFGTDGGIYTFDEATAIWTAYTTANTPGLGSDQIWSMDRGADGTLYFGTWWNGITTFNGNTWTNYNMSNSTIPTDFAWPIAIDPNGVFWLGNWGIGALNSWDKTSSATYLMDNVLFVLAIDIEPSGVKWFGTFSYGGYGGVYKYDDESGIWNHYTAAEGLVNENVQSLLVVPNITGIPDPPPTSPTGLLAKPGNKTVSLSWDDNTEKDFVGYNLYRSPTPAAGYIKLNATLLILNDYTDTAVNNGIRYYYQVTAVDISSNESDPSEEVWAIPADLIPPAVPIGLTATPGNMKVTLEWDKNSESDIIGYNIYRYLLVEDKWVNIGSPDNLTFSFTDSPLINKEEYRYKIKAFDPIFSSGFSEEVMTTPRKEFIPPGIPTGLVVTAEGQDYDTHARLSWDPSPDSDLAGYGIYIRKINSKDPFSYNLVTYLDLSSFTNPLAPTYLDLASNPSQYTFCYVLSAFDTSGNENGFSDPKACIKLDDTIHPAPPQNLHVTQVDDNGFIHLDWDDNTEQDLCGYNIYRWTNSDPTPTVVVSTCNAGNCFPSDGNDSSYIDMKVTPGEIYYYHVTAVDHIPFLNEGLPSNVVSAQAGTNTSVPPAPASISITQKESWLLRLDITVASVGVKDIAEYRIFKRTMLTGYPQEPLAVIKANWCNANLKHSDWDISDGTIYYYRAMTVDTAGNESGYSPEVSASAALDKNVPAQPQRLKGYRTAGRIGLSWESNTEADIKSYNIYRSIFPDTGYVQIGISGLEGGSVKLTPDIPAGEEAGVSFIDRNIENMKTYYYRISAVDMSNYESELSAVIAVKTSGVDLFVGGENGTSTAYQNIGMNRTLPVWSLNPSWNLPDVGNNASPVFADLDGDDDPDLLIGAENGSTYAYQNNGTGVTPVWVRRADWDPPAVASGDASPAIFDIDGDKDYDLLIGSFDGIAYGFMNIGGAVPVWSPEPKWDTPDIGFETKPAFIFRGKGINLLIGDYYGRIFFITSEDADIGEFWSTPVILSELKTQEFAAPTTGDLDGDGDLDLIIGDQTGYIYAYENSNKGWRRRYDWDPPKAANKVIPALINIQPKTDDHGNTYDTATQIPTDGTPIPGEIELAEDVDYFKFFAEHAITYIIETSDLSNEMDTVISLYDLDGTTVIEGNDNDGTEWNSSKIIWVPDSDGTYYISLDHANTVSGTGSYKISVRLPGKDDHGNTPEEATSVAADGTQTKGMIEVQQDINFFSFSMETGSTYIIETSSLSDDMDTYLMLYDTDTTTILAEDDDGGAEDYSSKIIWTANNSGIYFAAVRHYDPDGTGTYEISIRKAGGDDHANNCSNATTIAIGSDLSFGEIEEPEDIDCFRFRVYPGVNYFIETSELSNEMDTAITLYNTPDRTTIIQSNDDRHENDLSSEIMFSAPDGLNINGEYYYVTVNHYELDGTGSYAVSVSIAGLDDHGDMPASATVIKTDGTNVPGEIEIGGDVDYFAFAATEQNMYIIQTDNLQDNMDSFIKLYNPYFTPALICKTIKNKEVCTPAENDDSGNDLFSSKIEWQAPGNGTYYLEVRHYNKDAGTGRYDVSVLDLTPPLAPGRVKLSIANKDINLDWDDNKEYDLAGYNIYRSTTTHAGYTLISEGVNKSSYTDTRAETGKEYFYVITAIDTAKNESDFSLEVSTLTPFDNIPPSAPLGLTSKTSNDGEVSLVWDANTESDLEGYNIYRSILSGKDYGMGVYNYLGTTGENSFLDTKAIKRKNYYYVVAAFDLYGNESGYSNEVGTEASYEYDFFIGTGAGFIRPFTFSSNSKSDKSWVNSSVPVPPYVGESASPAIADLDGDQDNDMVIGNGDGEIFVYEYNNGAWIINSNWTSGINLTGEIYTAPALGDLDGDGDYDLVIGTFSGVIYFYENICTNGCTGGPVWEAASWQIDSFLFATPSPGEGYFASPAIADLDADGDYDLLIGLFSNSAAGFENTGTAHVPQWQRTNKSASWDSLDDLSGVMGKPIVTDMDMDGDIDLLVGQSSGKSIAYKNIGTILNPVWQRNSSWNADDIGFYAAPAYGTFLKADDHGNVPDTATEIILSQPFNDVSGTIDGGGDVDFFTFNTIAGSDYTIEGLNMDNFISLYASDMVTLITYDITENGTSKIAWSAESATTAYIKIRHTNGTKGTGSYTIRVTVSNQPPSALISASPQSGKTPLTVQFTGENSYDPDGRIITHRWNFGDDTTSDNVNPQHTYTNNSDIILNFTTSLTVTDNRDLTHTSSTVITVEPANHAPAALASVIDPIPASGTVPLTVKFSSAGSYDNDGSISAYHWDFGDGFYSDEQTPTHTYNKTGIYTARLIVTDNNGAQSHPTQGSLVTITIYPANIFAILSASSTMGAIAPHTVYFSGDVVIDPESQIGTITYEMNFGDGKSWTGTAPFVNLAHEYTKSGIFAAKLTVRETNGASAIDTELITIVNQPPQITLISADPLTGSAPLLITFAADAIDNDGSIVSYQWDFGDNNTLEGKAPQHTYQLAGTYTAQLTVKDNLGSIAKSAIEIVISNQAPTVSASAEPQPLRGNAPFAVTFSGTGDDTDGDLKNWWWDFGDGEVAAFEWNPAHTYNDPGEHTATLNVVDNLNAQAAESINISINFPPIAELSATPKIGKSPLSVSFTGGGTDSDGTIVSYLWNFGDGTGITSSLQNPEYTYNTEGEYTVTLTVTDNEGAAGVTGIMIIADDTPPIVNIINPIDGEYIKGSVSVDVDASDPNGIDRVEFFVDDILKYTAIEAPYSWDWVTTVFIDGTHTVAVDAYDLAGNSTVNSVSSIVDNTPPTVAITNPADGEYVRALISVAVDAADAIGMDRLEIYIDNVLQYTGTAVPYTWDWNTELFADGTHTIRVDAYDLAGNSAVNSVNSIVDNTPPTVAITNPADSEYVRALISVAVDAADVIDIDRVEIYVDNVLQYTGTVAPYTWNWDTALFADGVHTVRADAYDMAGNSAVNSVNSIVDNTPPTVVITNPADGEHVRAVISVAVNAADIIGMDRVEVYVDSVLQYTGTAAPYTWNWDTELFTDGVYTVRADAYDLAGNSVVDNVSVTMDNTPPTVNITAPADGSYLKGIVSVDADAADSNGIASVGFYLDGVLQYTDTVAPYTWQWDTTAGYAISSSQYNWVTTTIDAGFIDGDDDEYVTIPLPFPFKYYGVDYTLVNISTNGFLNFQGASTSYIPVPIPDSTEPNALLAVLWEDLYLPPTGGASITYASSTTQFSVTWEGLQFWSAHGTNPQTFQIVLNSDGSIIYQYSSITDKDQPVTIGMENQDGTQGVVYDLFPANNSAITYIPGDGQHTLSAAAYDIAGNEGISHDVNIIVDNTPPSVTIISPADGDYVKGIVSVNADATDAIGVNRVEFFMDGVLQYTDTAVPHTWSWDTTLSADGQYIIRTDVYDLAENVGTGDKITITVDNTAPVVNITEPIEGAYLKGTIPVIVDANDANGIDRVEFSIDGVIQSISLDFPYTWNWDTSSLPDGQYVIMTDIYDLAGNIGTGGDITVTVKNNLIFSEDFENGFDKWNMTGLWNPENETGSCGTQVSLLPTSANAAYYGIDGVCTYNNGSINNGTLTMISPVALPIDGNPVISFSSYEKTECSGDCSWDNRYIEISTDNGATWILLGKGNNEGVWYEQTFSLASYLGSTVLIRFRFDTVDGIYNDYFGWMVDNIYIYNQEQSFLFSENFENDFDKWDMTGLWNPENETGSCGTQVSPLPTSVNAAYYGIDGVCTYNNGNINNGTLTMISPVVLPTEGNPVMSFSSYEKTECSGDCAWDNRYIEISTDNGATWALLGKGKNEGIWYEQTFSLASYLGSTVLIRFRFDTVDGVYNDYFGWMVDNIYIFIDDRLLRN